MSSPAIIYLTIGSMLLFSCRQSQNVAGGPCSYTTTNYPATIIEMYELDSIKSELILVTNMFDQRDTLYFSAAAHEYITNEEIRVNNFKPGDTLSYQHKQITSGSCTPDIFRMTKERYKR